VFGKRLRDSQIDDLIFAMKAEGFLLKDAPRVVYKLDSAAAAQDNSPAAAAKEAAASGGNLPNQHIAALMN
jgi:hypothetical protein